MHLSATKFRWRDKKRRAVPRRCRRLPEAVFHQVRTVASRSPWPCASRLLEPRAPLGLEVPTGTLEHQPGEGPGFSSSSTLRSPRSLATAPPGAVGSSARPFHPARRYRPRPIVSPPGPPPPSAADPARPLRHGSRWQTPATGTPVRRRPLWRVEHPQASGRNWSPRRGGELPLATVRRADAPRLPPPPPAGHLPPPPEPAGAPGRPLPDPWQAGSVPRLDRGVKRRPPGRAAAERPRRADPATAGRR